MVFTFGYKILGLMFRGITGSFWHSYFNPLLFLMSCSSPLQSKVRTATEAWINERKDLQEIIMLKNLPVTLRCMITGHCQPQSSDPTEMHCSRAHIQHSSFALHLLTQQGVATRENNIQPTANNSVSAEIPQGKNQNPCYPEK